MKNYYDILEVNKKASKEVIDKAYRVLVKKYHPDMHQGAKKEYAEKKIKEINEAYNVLSDEFLKEQYDLELEKEEIKKNQSRYEEKIKTKEEKIEESNFEKKVKKNKVGSFGAIVELTKELIYDLRKNKERREEIKEITKKDIFAIILTIVIIFAIGLILWFIPFTNGWIRELIFENPIFNWIGGLFG